jgi:hypothetical protein
MIYTTQELINIYKNYQWTRTVKEVQIHHTWKPDHSNFNGNNHEQLQEGMKNYHVDVLGWSDIGQHLTLFPDGKWMIGRDWNKIPASIEGRNTYGFAIEMIGNFDLGYDKLQGEQLNSILMFLKYINLPIVFHNEYANKTCPGTSLNKADFVNAVINYGGVNSMLKVQIFGKDLELLDYKNENNLNYVNLRELFSKLSCDVKWDGEKVIVTLK